MQCKEKEAEVFVLSCEKRQGRDAAIQKRQEQMFLK
jgi:hypothetical protein